jgi:integrase
LPDEITKNGREHTFPYGSLTKQVLETIPAYAKQSQYLFPARCDAIKGNATTVFNGWSKAKKAFDATLEDVAPYKLHDLRRTFTSTLQRLGVPLEVREKLTNHISGTGAGVAGVYGQYGYEKEMKDAIRKYDAYLVKLLRSGKP